MTLGCLSRRSRIFSERCAGLKGSTSDRGEKREMGERKRERRRERERERERKREREGERDGG